jgi:uncharacterized protein (DUF2062 family)
MFRRRRKLALIERLRETLWPRAGWRRSTLYLFKRLARIKGTPYALAAGFACGAAVSFTPFVGFHFIISALIAWIIRANALAAVIGTAVGNPWTFPFIWAWVYGLGVWMGVGGVSAGTEEMDFAALSRATLDALWRLDMVYLGQQAWPWFGPMLAGSIPTAVVVWLAVFLPLKPAIEAQHHRRRTRS